VAAAAAASLTRLGRVLAAAAAVNGGASAAMAGAQAGTPRLRVTVDAPDGLGGSSSASSAGTDGEAIDGGPDADGDGDGADGAGVDVSRVAALLPGWPSPSATWRVGAAAAVGPATAAPAAATPFPSCLASTSFCTFRTVYTAPLPAGCH